MNELIDALRCDYERNCWEEKCPYLESSSYNDCNTKRKEHDAADAIEELISRVPKWIDANERLPEQTGEYIVFLKASKKWIDAGEDVSYTTAMWFVKEQKIWKEMNGDDSYNAVLPAVDADWACSVTHWMELPKPLKGE